MPTYEYKCEACGGAFERFQSITSAPVRKCPVCGKNKVKRLISAGAGLIFKGSGFYITDYRSDGYKSAAKSDSGTPAPASNGEGAKTGDSSSKPAEAKPAAATPAPTASKAPAASAKSAKK